MNGRFDIVVPVGAKRSPIDPCMDALRREAGDEVRVVSEHFAWQARERALEESTSEIVVFVDPDVVVAEGWLSALSLAWDAAPNSIAAIGGPIHGDAPGWARGRLGLLDLGGDVLDVDPIERTLFAGNLSFRRRAMLGVGGFAPPLDRQDAADWLSEEHEAQRQLGHWGWLLRYAPAIAAERVITEPAPVRRAWRYGVRSGLAGGRDRALPQALKSGAGSVAAALTLRRETASERAARAAENLGALTGKRRARTPGRSAAHPTMAPGKRTGRLRSAGAQVDVVLLYHRFATGEPDPLELCVSPEHFEEQLRVLKDEAEVVPLADIAAALSDDQPAAGRVAITIDDGYLDNLTTGIPMIAAAGMPATLFAATGHIETGRRFFWDEMARLLTGPGPRPKRLELDGRNWRTATAGQREIARQELHRATQPKSSEEIEATLAHLRDWAGDGVDGPPDTTRPVTVEELRRLSETPGLEIGAHTRDHVNLGHQGIDDVRRQVERSRDDVASWTGTAPAAFSYPFGIPRHDVTDAAREAVAAAGFRYAVANQPVPVESRDDVFAIPRLFAPDVDGEEFRLWLQRALA